MASRHTAVRFCGAPHSVLTYKHKPEEEPAMIRLLAAASFAALLTACASNVPLDDKPATPVENKSVPAPGSTAPSAQPGATGAMPTVDARRNDAAPTAGAPQARSVFFDFDSFTLRDEAKPIIEAHARFLTANPNTRVVLEGNTDERGGREYNLALGQKRSEAVKRALTLLGVRESQLEAVSFGEEKPRATGSDEAAWAENRRVDIAYR